MKRISLLPRTAMVAALAAPLSAAAGDLFDGLSPDRVGAELTAVLEEAELACTHDSSDPQLRHCNPLPGALNALGSISLGEVEALFVDQHLARVTAYFAERRFDDVRRTLSERLGDSTDWTIVIRAGMAGQFTDQIRIWENDHFVLIAQQFDRKIDRSSVIYGTPASMAELLRRIKSTPAGSMRDL
ncbi:MAG: hypothetical protein C5B46_04345 [Proteobacteria bacterium]|nr:MAG: hypothetical protein C5B46_04345 [Pseudomonadota bacterium]